MPNTGNQNNNMTHQSVKGSFFQELTPATRFFISFAFTVLAYFIIPKTGNHYFDALVWWDVFSFCYLFLCWVVFFTMPVKLIRRNAAKEDGSKVFVFTMILVCSLISMVAVLLLMKGNKTVNQTLMVIVSILAMTFSWAIVHSIFTFHYGHLFYSAKPEGGLEFPCDEKEPDYLDLAYFSFGVGCTFQVADVEISSARIRRLVLFHSLLSFMLNTCVVALSINIISGLVK